MVSELKPRLYAVHVLTNLKRPINKFIHIGVECYYQQNHILHIEEQKRNQINDNRTLFQYDMDHVKEIRVREIMRDKI